MPRRVLWRSWSALEARFELARFAEEKLPFTHQWLNAHEVQPTPDDIYLTTNGYDWRAGSFSKATLYAESYQYLKNEYNNYGVDNKWDHRFHFNPIFAGFPKSSLHNISCFWRRELKFQEETLKNKKPEFTFGMVLSKKPTAKTHPCEFGWYRTEVVQKSKGRSFAYYGAGWQNNDTNYKGEAYVHGHRGTPVKFHDARILMAKAKFVWCLENIHDQTYAPNYLTEKIFHGFLSASVPIYAGCWNIEQLVPPDLFIDARKFNMDPVLIMNHCEKMSDTEYKGYQERINMWLHGPGLSLSMEDKYTELDLKLLKRFG